MSRRLAGGGPLLLLPCVLLLLARPALAVSAKTWTVRSQKEFLEGEPEGLRVTAAGELVLAPRFVERAVLEEPVVWAVAPGPDGSAWVGTGSGGRLLRVAADGKVEVAARFDEQQVTALLADGEEVYAATAPEGSVYRVRAGREPERLARIDAQYVWSLARGEDGTLYAGTGTEGRVYAVRGGEAHVHYDAPDLHVMSLLALPGGELAVGTDERGLVVRLDREGRPTVLYDSALKEARALAWDPESRALYAAVNGAASRETGPPAPRPSEATVTVSAGEGSEGGAAQAPPLTLAAPEAGGDVTGEVVRILTGSPVETVARTRGELVYALELAPGGELFIGTSKRLLVPAGGEDVTVVALKGSGASGQVSALARAGRALLVGTTGPSRLYALASGVEREATYTSKVFAAEGRSRWGSLRWEAEVPEGAALALQARSGGTQEPDASWSPWSPELLAPGPPAVPEARFVQWRARFTTRSREASPRLRSVSLAYLPENLRPVIRSVQAQPPGVLFQKSAGGPGVLESIPPPLPSMFPELGPARGEPGGPGKRLYRRGAQTLVWEAADPNDDDLLVRLHVRALAGGPPLPVRERPEGSSFTFDTEVLPDGWYLGRVEVDDSPANAAATALSAVKESEPFLVDNTPPVLRLVESAARGRRARARFVAEDRLSALWRAEWSLDGGSFVPLFPVDAITDGLVETYEVETEPLDKGEHLIVVRVADLSNQGAAAAARVVIE